MTIDITNITLMSQPDIVELCHKATAIPSLLIAYSTTLAVLFFSGLYFVRESRGRFMTIFFTTLAISSIFLVAIIFMPNTIQTISNWFTGLF
jgi:hypothetical protein